MDQDSSAGIPAGDTAGGGSMVLVPIRWEQAQIDRANALAEASGLPRSLIMRSVFDAGIGVIEQRIAALVGVAPETGESA